MLNHYSCLMSHHTCRPSWCHHCLFAAESMILDFHMAYLKFFFSLTLEIVTFIFSLIIESCTIGSNFLEVGLILFNQQTVVLSLASLLNEIGHHQKKTSWALFLFQPWSCYSMSQKIPTLSTIQCLLCVSMMWGFNVF